MSVLLSSALVASTMTVPAMAAANDGTITAEMGLRNAVLRVQLPTKMKAEIDPLEMVDQGTQIYSQVFEMKNKSQVPVKVSVNSVVAPTSPVTLQAAKTGASSNANGVWLAAAAQTKLGVYDDERTVSEAETLETLSDGNSNVATFNATSKSASQNFYLDRCGDETSDPIVYHMLSGNGDDYKTQYTQIYELTADETISTNDNLQDVVDDHDVYWVVSANVSTNDGVKTATVHKIERMAECVSGGNNGYVSDNRYYTAADTPESVTATGVALTDGKHYVYGETEREGEVAAFRYIGKLHPDRNWQKTDIGDITINYNIKGVMKTEYTEKQPYCVYGLEGSTSVNAAGPRVQGNPDGTITFTGLTAEKNLVWESAKVTHSEGELYLQGTADLTWDTSNYSDENGGDVVLKLEQPWLVWLGGQEVTISAELTDGSELTTNVTLATVS